MDDSRFGQLSEQQKQVLRLVFAHYKIKEIAAMLDLHESSVNERLRRARATLGAGDSASAARMLAEHEQAQGTWISPTGSRNTLTPEPFPPASEDASDGGAPPDELLADIGIPSKPSGPIRLSGSNTGWPFPTSGRPNNDLSTWKRFAWMFPCTVIALLAILLLADLSIGLQDVLGDLAHRLARAR